MRKTQQAPEAGEPPGQEWDDCAKSSLYLALYAAMVLVFESVAGISFFSLMLACWGIVFALLGLRGPRRRRQQIRTWLGLIVNGALIFTGVRLDLKAHHIHFHFKPMYLAVRSGEEFQHWAIHDAAHGSNVVGYARSGTHSNSTDYLRDLYEVHFPADPNEFARRTTVPRIWRTTSPTQCDWCVVADTDHSTEAGFPFAFTANVRGERVSDLVGTVGSTLDPDHPCGTKYAALIIHGAHRGRMLRHDESWDEILAPFRHLPDRPILRP